MTFLEFEKKKGSKSPKLIEKYKGGKIHKGVGEGEYYFVKHPKADYSVMGGLKSVDSSRKEIDKIERKHFENEGRKRLKAHKAHEAKESKKQEIAEKMKHRKVDSIQQKGLKGFKPRPEGLIREK